MASSPAYSTVKDIIATEVAKHGWTTRSGPGIGVGTKDYSTAVGLKEALVTLCPSSEYAAIMMAEYQSEGQNVLSTVWYPISEECSADQIQAIVSACLSEVDKRVAQTYAMRLARHA